MPIYEYQCSQCEHHLEHLQKISDSDLVTCPECHQDSLTRLISASGFRLKGQGWYETDFKNKDKPKTSPPETEIKTESAPKETSQTTKATKDTMTASTDTKSEKSAHTGTCT